MDTGYMCLHFIDLGEQLGAIASTILQQMVSRLDRGSPINANMHMLVWNRHECECAVQRCMPLETLTSDETYRAIV
eukprot:5020049-Amphidinium_carterae.2